MITIFFPVILIFIIAMKGSSRNSKPYTYLALGDSYTIGEQVESKDNFPNQVVAILNKKGVDFSDPIIVARTGWTTDELADAISKAELRTSYDFVTLLIGVNNQYRGRTVAGYIQELESLLQKAIQFAGNDTTRVIVLSIPDWGVTPFANDRNRQQIAKEIDTFNTANKQVSENYKVHYLDITPGTKEAGKDTSLLTSDGLHPSAKEYSRWAERIATIIENKLPF